MKYLLILFFLVPALSFGQCITLPDSVFNNTATLITATTARINGDGSNGDVANNFIKLRYVRVGQTDTVTSTTAWPTTLRNLTGLQSGTQYVYYYSMNCGDGDVRQLGRYYFTTLSSAVVYATERSTVFPYVKLDTGFVVPRQDTALFRQVSTTGGNIVFNPTDSVFYGYNKARWVPLMSSTAGISNKVDSVTVSGDSLFYWVNGTGYGYILPTYDYVDSITRTSGVDSFYWWKNGVSTAVLDSTGGGGSSGWSLTGNSGTTAGTNFIGTTDSVDFVVKTKALERLRVNANGALGVGTGTDYGTAGYVLSTNGNGTAPTWVINNNNFDATVDFSVNANPNTGGTTFNPNTPQLTTKIYVSTVDGSQWTWNGTAYVIYTSIGWNTFGNAGTTSSNFIGTTDNTPLNFRVNNIAAGVINQLTYNTSFGYQTLASHITGAQNTSIGYNSMFSDTSGANNTAIGFSAMQSNLSGASNTAIGGEALYSNTTGISNIAIGNQAGFENTTESNQLYISNQSYGGYDQDTAKSIIWGEMSSTVGNQRIRLNSRIFAHYIPSGVGDKAVRWNSTTKEFTYADTTTGGGSSTITNGTTAMSGFTNTYIPYNNAGTIGQYAISGTGNVAMSASPTFTGTITGAEATFTSAATTGTGFNIASSTITSGSLATFTNTGTAAASNTKKVLTIASSGANATSTQTVTGQTISVTNTGTTSTNVGLNVTASGATNNYAGLFTGFVGIGGTPTSTLWVSAASAPSASAINWANSSGDVGGNVATSSTLSITTNNSSVGVFGQATGAITSIGVLGKAALGKNFGRNVGVVGQANNTGSSASFIGVLALLGASTPSYTSAALVADNGSISANIFSARDNGTEVFAIINGGNVGVAAASPTTKLQVAGNFASQQGADVASTAGVMTLGTDGNSFEITGTNTITAINNTGWVNGSEVILLFTSTAVLTDGTANSGTSIGIELAGSANFTASAGATIKLILSEIGGTQAWREVSRSVN